MGVNLFDALGGAVTFPPSAPVNHVQNAEMTSSVQLTEYPTLLKPTAGTLKEFIHRPQIDPTVRPVQQKFWHPPLAMRDAIATELRRMEAEGVIEPVDASAWMSNLVTARKKDGGVRLCVNLTAVNKAIIPQRFPLPTMDELTARIAGNTVFSKIDLLGAYLQLELAPEVRSMTSFVSHIGCFRFRRLPFGLASGPSAFQQVINRILDGLPGAVAILDDILIYGRNMDEHDNNLRRVLQRLERYGATLRQDKCVIGQSSVDFNGHRVSVE